ncbi:hypothetical protein ACWD4G_39730 [Streptomyces sp. NPDC002643]
MREWVRTGCFDRAPGGCGWPGRGFAHRRSQVEQEGAPQPERRDGTQVERDGGLRLGRHDDPQVERTATSG